MSLENVEVVRGLIGPYEGRDLAAAVREADAGVDLDDPEAVSAVAAMVTEDPSWRHVDSDVVWDATGVGLGFVARGKEEVIGYWRDWAGLWETYVYRVAEYRDLGDWVLTVSDLHVRGREGIDVGMRVFQAWEVREGKIVTMLGYTSERQALAAIEAAGLRE